MPVDYFATPGYVNGEIHAGNISHLDVNVIGNDVASPIDTLALYCDTTIGSTTNGRDLYVYLDPAKQVVIDGSTQPQSQTGGALYVAVETVTNSAIKAIQVDLVTHNLGNTEWAYGVWVNPDVSAALTATSNMAAMYLVDPDDTAQCTTYGLYVEAGYDYGIAVLSPVMLSSLILAPLADPTPYPLHFQLEGFGIPGTGTTGVYTQGRVINMAYGAARTLDGVLNGIYLDFSTNLTVGANVVTGMYMDISTGDEANPSIGISIVKNVTAAGGTRAVTGSFIDLTTTLTAGAGVGATYNDYFIDMDIDLVYNDTAVIFSGGFLDMTLAAPVDGNRPQVYGDMVRLVMYSIVPAQTLRGFYIDSNVQLNDAAAVHYGMEIDMTGVTLTNYLTEYGLFIQMQGTYGAGADAAIYATGNGNIFGALTGDGVYLLMGEVGSTGVNVLSDTADAVNAKIGMSISKDITGGTAARAMTESVLDMTVELESTGAGGNITWNDSFIDILFTLTETAGIVQTTGYPIQIELDSTGGRVAGGLMNLIYGGTGVFNAPWRGIYMDIDLAHDGAAADVLMGVDVHWTGDMPGGTCGLLTMLYAEYLGTLGSGGADGGEVVGLEINLIGATINSTSGVVYGVHINADTMTLTNYATEYGLFIEMQTAYGAGADAAVYATGAGNQLGLLQDTYGVYLNILDATTLASPLFFDLEVFPTGNVIEMAYSAAESLTGALVGIEMDFTTNVTQAAFVITAINALLDTTDEANNAIFAVVSKDLTNTTGAPRSMADDVIDLSVALVNSGAGSTVDWTDFFIDMTLNITQADATSSLTGGFIDMTVNQVGGVLSLPGNTFVNLAIEGTVGAGTVTGYRVDTAAVILDDGAAIYYGMYISQSTITLTNYSIQYGLFIEMQPAYGAGLDAAIWATGNGNTFGALTGDGVYIQMREAASVAINIDTDVANDTSNDQDVIVITHDVNQTAAAAIVHDGYLINYDMNLTCGAVAGSATRQTNPIINLNVDLSAGVAGTSAITTGFLAMTVAAAGGAGTERIYGDMVSMTLAGTNDQAQDLRAFYVDANMTVNHANASFYGLDINMDNVTIGAANATDVIGARIELDGITQTGAATRLYGMHVILPPTNGVGIFIQADSAGQSHTGQAVQMQVSATAGVGETNAMTADVVTKTLTCTSTGTGVMTASLNMESIALVLTTDAPPK